MTDSANVEVVRRGLEALGRWDVDALLPDCDPDGRLVWSQIHSGPGEARRRYEADARDG